MHPQPLPTHPQLSTVFPPLGRALLPHQSYTLHLTSVVVWIGGNVSCTPTMEISVAILQEVGKRSTSRSSFTTLGHTPKEVYILEARSQP